MQLVAVKDGVFFRGVSTTDDYIEADKAAIIADAGTDDIVFLEMSDTDFETWLESQ